MIQPMAWYVRRNQMKHNPWSDLNTFRLHWPSHGKSAQRTGVSRRFSWWFCAPIGLYDRQMEGFLAHGRTSLRHIKSVHPCHQQLWSKTDLSATTPLGPHQMRESLRGKSKLCSPREGLANPLWLVGLARPPQLPKCWSIWSYLGSNLVVVISHVTNGMNFPYRPSSTGL